MKHLRATLLSLCLGTFLISSLQADEGMWLFTAPPREDLKVRHGFELTPAWLEHLQRASVAFSGASGSFVSADGLVLTNHHVGRPYVQKVSTAERNLVREGFVARTLSEEIPVPGMELKVLQTMEDVTERVNAAVPAGATGEVAAAARRRAFTTIETEAKARTGLECSIVILYQGGQYHLYGYRRYADVRLVFAPESAVAAFGGDADNFEYPRYCLDVALFRVYENGQPAKVEHFLKWAEQPVAENELVFVSGHPGRTDRQLTFAEIAYQRDVALPRKLAQLIRSEVLLSTWGARDAENLRRAGRTLPSVQNNRKRTLGQLAALQDPEFLARKAQAEADFKNVLQTRGESAALAAFDRIAGAQAAIARDSLRYGLLEGEGAFAGVLYDLARDLLRVADERARPNGERLREYTDAKKESLEQWLFEQGPIHADLEAVRLADSLASMVEQLGADDPTVRTVLAGQSPRRRAAELIRTTKVGDLAFRRHLYAGDAAVVAAAQDPLIELARSVDAEARQLRTAIEGQGEIIRQAHAEIARARFALLGPAQAPDATGTLRLSYGVVKGYTEAGSPVPFQTVTAGLFARNRAQENRPPFSLPTKWREAADRLEGTMPFNYVTTCDTVGGNSGSPVVNRAGELVGLVFDGNLASLADGFAYDERESRAVNVAPGVIVDSLRQVYAAEALARELIEARR